MTPSNFRARGVYLPAAEPSRPGNMKLNLHPLDLEGDVRARAHAALEKIASEARAAIEPLPKIDARDDAEERAKAAAKRYRQTPAGKAANLIRMRARSSARREAALA